VNKKLIKGILATLALTSIPATAEAQNGWGHHRISHHHHRYARTYGGYGYGGYQAYGNPYYSRSAVIISTGGHGHHYEYGHDVGHGYRQGYGHDGGGYSFGHNGGHGDDHGYGHGYGGHGDGHH
jgi:hypothetical protein